MPIILLIAQTFVDFFRIVLTWPSIIFTIFLVIFFNSEKVSEFVRSLIEEIDLQKKGVNRIKLRHPQPKNIGNTDDIKLPDTKETEKNKIRFEKDKAIELYAKLAVDYAKLMTDYQFERIYHYIYGSQIKLLLHLKSKPNNEDNLDCALTFYNLFLKRSNNNVSYGVEQYMNFLSNSQLVVPISTLKIKITDKGIKFLNYIEKLYSSELEFKAF